MNIQEAHGEETSEILCDTHERRHDSPGHGQSWKPELGRCSLEDNVTRYFKQDIADEIESQASEVLIASHLQVSSKTLDSRVRNYEKSASLAKKIMLKSSPLLRSKNDRRYKIETAGKSLRSSFLSNLASLTPPAATASSSESELVEAAGCSSFPSIRSVVFSVAMAPVHQWDKNGQVNQQSAVVHWRADNFKQPLDSLTRKNDAILWMSATSRVPKP